MKGMRVSWWEGGVSEELYRGRSGEKRYRCLGLRRVERPILGKGCGGNARRDGPRLVPRHLEITNRWGSSYFLLIVCRFLRNILL